MKYRVMRTMSNGVITANYNCGESKNEALYQYARQLTHPAKYGSIMLLADNVIVRKDGVCSRLEKAVVYRYLKLEKPSWVKKLVVKLKHIK